MLHCFVHLCTRFTWCACSLSVSSIAYSLVTLYFTSLNLIDVAIIMRVRMHTIAVICTK